MSEIKQFKTEVRKVLDLVIHSLYTNKDIFLRELISNASDAIDKARFESLTKPDIVRNWKITIEINKRAGEISISDNGIGMNKDEIEENIGTIAKSGTKAFLEKLAEEKNLSAPELIGQFGVGFYSAFMVADEIIIESKRAGTNDPPVLWKSKGEDSYEISEGKRAEQGTEIRLRLKANNDEYFESWKIKEIVKKYSDFIEYPIHLCESEKGSQKEESEKPLNSMKALWIRKPEELTEEDYKQFYAHLSHFDKEPLTKIHFSAEGTINFKALLYIPSEAPPFFLQYQHQKRGVHLYIRRVFISDSCEELLPEYFRFIKGVVESDDLPLNISRETLQKNPQIEKINKNLTRKIISELGNILEKDREKYQNFYSHFSPMLKEGVNSDFQNREKLLDLLLFENFKGDGNKTITLKEFVEKLPPGQNKLYYASGEKTALLRHSPLLDIIRKNDFDALLITEPIDEYIFQTIGKYKDKEFVSLNSNTIEIEKSAELQELKNDAEKKYKDVIELMKKTLDSKVKEVKFSDRLTSVPACLFTEQFAPSRQMEKLMKAMKMDVPESKKILELNPSHSFVKTICEKYQNSKDETELAKFTELLYDMALIADGEIPSNGPEFIEKISYLISGK
ncbi:MAG TPA: molecular chaperone HtpG [Victivallales bacterium]|nr:molecular chaperone HtpG [Victivallales bacterium]HPO90093.1 molecular chaperone HtpG [Victivallales bacterium]HRR05876.1 molecular chaperone HtpG [Victivallales bacterium]HRR28443.1 molecular chaperone HtpG [Victivallales bacterium]HRU00695.1 molecular chaperone HtpG [Victivallales bacterium]